MYVKLSSWRSTDSLLRPSLQMETWFRIGGVAFRIPCCGLASRRKLGISDLQDLVSDWQHLISDSLLRPTLKAETYDFGFAGLGFGL
jgi:hypothetical protein